MDTASLRRQIGKLRICSDLAQSCAVFAEILGKESGAAACAVFLLDCTGTRLLPWAHWEDGQCAGRRKTPLVGTSSPPGLSQRYISSDSLLFDAGDPLCFAMQSGRAYHARPLSEGADFACLAFLPPAAHRGGLLALPLVALKDICIGGALLGLRPASAPREADASLLCDLGALALDAHLQRGKEQEKLRSLHEDITRLENASGSDRGVVAGIFLGVGAAARRIRENITRAAEGDFPVLITGETGTGKELAAQALHAASPRRGAPFVRINCGALPQQLMESELFGHCKGAFSGADAEHPGLLRSAHGGTVLLDEVGEMPLPLQVKLLRVLQDHEVRPVGGLRSFPVDLRIVAATNRDMREAMAAGTFRQDLYYRLAALHIHLPPLRERREDILVLAEHFLERTAMETKRPYLRLAPESRRMLRAGDFPGNARQLRDIIRCAVFMADAGVTCLTPEMLLWREDGVQESAGASAVSGGSGGGLAEEVRQFELRLIEATLVRCGGNVTEAARELALPRSTLASKLKKRNADSLAL